MGSYGHANDNDRQSAAAFVDGSVMPVLRSCAGGEQGRVHRCDQGRMIWREFAIVVKIGAIPGGAQAGSAGASHRGKGLTSFLGAVALGASPGLLGL